MPIDFGFESLLKLDEFQIRITKPYTNYLEDLIVQIGTRNINAKTVLYKFTWLAVSDTY